MDLIIIVGPQAVGKMTVGEELAKQTEYKLFHNHMTIDFILKLFSWEDGKHLVQEFRERVFNEFLKTDNKGLIFTYVWAFELKSEWEYIKHLKTLYKEENVYIVELYSDLDTRLIRNKTENRLEKKWTKRNIEESDQRLVDTLKKHRTTSYDGEVTDSNYIKIDNTKLSAQEVVNIVTKEFNLQ